MTVSFALTPQLNDLTSDPTAYQFLDHQWGIVNSPLHVLSEVVQGVKQVYLRVRCHDVPMLCQRLEGSTIKVILADLAYHTDTYLIKMLFGDAACMNMTRSTRLGSNGDSGRPASLPTETDALMPDTD